MNPATQLKIEFFELLRLLNKSNLTTNQKTEISFFIENRTDKVTLCATTNQIYKIQLISQIGRHEWLPCGFSGLDLIEKELSKLFKYQNPTIQSADEITKKITSFIFKKLDE